MLASAPLGADICSPRFPIELRD